MMQNFIHRFEHNIRHHTPKTMITVVGLLVLGWFLGYLVKGTFLLGPVTYWVTIPATIWIASRIPQMNWFFGRDLLKDHRGKKASDMETNDNQALNADGSHPASQSVESNEIDLSRHAIRPRTTPVGTILVSYDENYADVRVQSVIHFWCWFAPMALCASALIIVPFGAWLGFQTYSSSIPWHAFKSGHALSASFTGAFIALVLCIAAAIWSYFKNRPNVRVEITPEFIRYGDMLFDRQYEDGMTIGYKTGEAELKAKITDDKLGVTRLRLRYGRWGEDLKYMVNSYYAAEIVIFLNEVIDGVGAEEETGDNADRGLKTELL